MESEIEQKWAALVVGAAGLMFLLGVVAGVSLADRIAPIDSENSCVYTQEGPRHDY